MRLIVIGASGLIGQQLLSDAQADGREVVGTGHRRVEEGLIPFDMRIQTLADLVPDLGNGDAVFILGAQIDPNWVFQHPQDSREINVRATCRLIDEALAADAWVFFASSEMVYNGEVGGYVEEDAPDPLTLYGAQKFEVETHLATQQGRWTVLRTGWTVGPAVTDRCPVTNTYRALLDGSARLASDNVFTLTDVQDVSRGFLKLLDGDYHGIYHVTANPAVARDELGEWIVAESALGLQMSFEQITFGSLEFAEPRPAKAWLSNERYVGATGHVPAPARETVARKVAAIDAQMAEQRMASL